MANAETVYWYSAEMRFGDGYYQKYLYKSPHLYEVGDKIIKRYGSGAVVALIITYGFGSCCPEYYIHKLQYESTWPPILSDI